MPSIANVMTARKQADNATERNCRDFHALIQHIYNEDPEIESAANIRSVGVASYSWQIVALDGKESDAVELANQRLKPLIDKFISYSWEGSFYGALALKLEWRLESGWIPRVFNAYDIDQLNWAQDQEKLQIYDENAKKYAEIPESDRENWILYTEGKSPGGALRKLLINRVIQAEMVREWGNYNAQAKGVVTGKVSDSGSQEEISAVGNAITDIYKRNFAILGPESDIVFKEMVAGGVYTSFKEIVDMLDSKCRIVLLGQSNTSELPNGGGSRAALQVQRMITADKILADMIRCENVINEQIIPTYWRKNSGTDYIPIKFEFIWQEDIDPEARISVIDTMLRNKIPVKASEIYLPLGLTKPDEAPDVFLGGDNVFGT